MRSGIYKITCTINGKGYIGKTEDDIEKRVMEHLNNRSPGCVALFNAIKKHGKKILFGIHFITMYSLVFLTPLKLMKSETITPSPLTDIILLKVVKAVLVQKKRGAKSLKR